jgi:GT2 family glycosyltransferase
VNSRLRGNDTYKDMKVSVIFALYNSKKFIKPVFDAVFAQTHKELQVIAVFGNYDGSKEQIEKDYPQVQIIDPGKNLGFAAANNLGIRSSDGEFVQLVNQDLILESNYIEELLKAFDDGKVAAATGKLLRYDFEKFQKTNIIDSTGVVMSSSGRAKDRGQLEIDHGQYDNKTEVFGVSGAAPMYRREALEAVKYEQEYYDEDFFMYWEDVDLSWRLNNAGWKNVYVPAAVGYHARTAGQSKGGYLHLLHFIKHHQTTISPLVRKLNYKNHILMYIKNAKHIWHPAFILREIAMLGYILVFETRTLAVIPKLLGQIPRILKKRRQKKDPDPATMA